MNRHTIPELLDRTLNATEQRYAPAEVYSLGDLTLARERRRVSIVGTRTPSPEGRARTKRLARLLVAEGVVVVSGLAAGIDGEAHRAVIDAGGSTIAVLGTPLGQYYPAEHRELQDEIARDHLLLSQFALGGGPKYFVIRNRTMALISQATVIVEAGEKSGTEHQGWEALRLGRPLFITRALFEQGAAWVLEQHRYGAQVLSEETVPDLLDSLATAGVGAAPLALTL